MVVFFFFFRWVCRVFVISGSCKIRNADTSSIPPFIRSHCFFCFASVLQTNSYFHHNQRRSTIFVAPISMNNGWNETKEEKTLKNPYTAHRAHGARRLKVSFFSSNLLLRWLFVLCLFHRIYEFIIWPFFSSSLISIYVATRIVYSFHIYSK